MSLFFIKLLLGIALLSFCVTVIGALSLFFVMICILVFKEEFNLPIVYVVADVTLISFVVFLIMLAVNDMSDK